MKPIIVYFRQDLRLEDNPALYRAAQKKAPLIPVYIFDTENPGQWQIGSAQKWWLHHSLQSLMDELENRKAKLIIRKGNPIKILEDLVNETEAEGIYYNRCYEPYAIKRDTELKKLFADKVMEVKSFNGSLLIEPWQVETKSSGEYYKVFTPFWKACLRVLNPEKPLPIPDFTPYEKQLKSGSLNELDLLPKHDWAGGIEKHWTPGAAAAKKQLNAFIKNDLKDYKQARDLPGEDQTSHLSPYLHLGEISPREVWHAVKQSSAAESHKKAVDCFLSEMGWREFSYNLLFHFPGLPEKPFASKFKDFKWDESKEKLSAWQKGKTGYPIVDAGMRQLWKIGWMHNRVRMITASFLIKDLFIHWKKGEEWFWDTLVDADLASNSASWQWVAGSGADAAPYFRIFNPVLQGEKFDPEGKYVRKWIPELEKLPNKYIHKPWEAPDEALDDAGIVLGEDYPQPIVDHKEARDEALNRFEKIK